MGLTGAYSDLFIWFIGGLLYINYVFEEQRCGWCCPCRPRVKLMNDERPNKIIQTHI